MQSGYYPLLEDLQNDYKKLINECKKKYFIIKEVLEISIKAIDNLKSLSKEHQTQPPLSDKIISFENELSVSIEILIKPISLITDNKHTKLYLYCTFIIKKLVTYNFISTNQSKQIIRIIKELFDYSNEEIQLKILETLQSMLNSNKIPISSQESLITVLCISCKLFMLKNTEFKNPLRLLFQTFIKTICDVVNKEQLPKRTDTNQGVISFIKVLIEIGEGKKKEWVQNTIYSKCLGIELLCQFITNFKSNNKNNDIFTFIENEAFALVLKILPITNEYLTGVKLTRLTVLLMVKLNCCFELIDTVLKLAEKESITWHKIIGLEALSELLLYPHLLIELYTKHNNQYDKIITALTEITYKNVIIVKNNSFQINNNNPSISLTSSSKKGGDIKDKTDISLTNLLSKTKSINNSSILIENEQNIITPIHNIYLYKLLIDCFVNIKNSYIALLEKENVSIGKINEINEQIIPLQKFLQFKYVDIKGALIGLLLHSNDIGVSQNYLMIFQAMITIYASVSLYIERDEYLNDLCKLALPNNLVSFYEMKEKNILIIQSIFNMVHCENILDTNSWLLLFEMLHNLYYVLVNSNNYSIKQNELFDINVIVNHLETNIKKYSYDTPSIEIKEILQKSESIVSYSNNNKAHNSNNGKHSGNSISLKEIGSGVIGLITKKKLNEANTAIKKQLTNEEKENLLLLSNIMDSLFIEADKMDVNAIQSVAMSLKESSLSIINKQSTNGNTINEPYITYLQFNLCKCLELSVVNVKRLDVIWNEIALVLNTIALNNCYCKPLSLFVIDISTIIICYYISKHTDNNNCNDNEILSKLFYPLTQIIINIKNVQTPLNNDDMIQCLISNCSRILTKCGIYLNKNSWSNYINLLSQITLLLKLSLTQFEQIFKIIEEIFNEYSSYLVISNISQIRIILESFSLSKENDNICYSAIALFWSCANLLENFQTKKNPLPDTSDNFFNSEWLSLFNTLLHLNKDSRFDVRKSGINLFSQFFVAKISTLSIISTLPFEILTSIFFKILTINNQTYVAQQTQIKEYEDTLVITLQAIEKVVKCFFTNNTNEKTEQIYFELISLLKTICKTATPNIYINVIKVLSEIPNCNSKMFIDNFNSIWEIIDMAVSYVESQSFMDEYSNSNIGSKLILFIIESFSYFFFLPETHTLIIDNDDNFEHMLNIVKLMLKCALLTEGTLPQVNPLRLLRIEREIFDFVDDLLINIQNEVIYKKIYAFLSGFIKHDGKNEHNEAIKNRALESMNKIFQNTKLDFELKLNDKVDIK